MRSRLWRGRKHEKFPSDDELWGFFGLFFVCFYHCSLICFIFQVVGQPEPPLSSLKKNTEQHAGTDELQLLEEQWK